MLRFILFNYTSMKEDTRLRDTMNKIRLAEAKKIKIEAEIRILEDDLEREMRYIEHLYEEYAKIKSED